MNQNDVFLTTPKRTLEERIESFLFHIARYEIPVAAGVFIGAVCRSEVDAGILGGLTALSSGYARFLQYCNDFVVVYPDYKGDSELERQFVFRGTIGGVRGGVEGCALMFLGLGIERYVEQVHNFVK